MKNASKVRVAMYTILNLSLNDRASDNEWFNSI